ncbi:hypothetical protein B0J11DRAFT_523336 [Dendryphion nanum]|uniref:Uncharacterized protein n=1 Tax=Dendryphion nanum TaxID=256645 RepID=A0A9P9IRI3_9PLEO|nr:hypothetical protein B0J11DRAFT_523336 [Dendryphion nanum]
MKATFFTVSALIAAAFAAPAPVLDRRAEFDISIQLFDDFSGRFSTDIVPSDGYVRKFKTFANIALLNRVFTIGASSAQIQTPVPGVQCTLYNITGLGTVQLNERKNFIDFIPGNNGVVDVTEGAVSCIVKKST